MRWRNMLTKAYYKLDTIFLFGGVFVPYPLQQKGKSLRSEALSMDNPPPCSFFDCRSYDESITQLLEIPRLAGCGKRGAT